ncbi:MAG: hypothetical protein JO122_07535 [Acetobacteraceae bacterium]|nr:hypothetical protein [Acetobacteraceae bacterium]
MKMFCSLIAGGALLALASTAFAGQPLQLTDRQLDGVTAGGAAIADGFGFAFGDVSADTQTMTLTNVAPGLALGKAASLTVAAGLWFPAVAASHSDATATAP